MTYRTYNGYFYLASPYSSVDADVREERYHKVMCHSANLLKKGIIAYSPIVYSHEMSKKFEMPSDADFWWFFNKIMLDKCDVLMVYKMQDWDKSKGVKQEIDYALENDIPIVYCEEEKT